MRSTTTVKFLAAAYGLGLIWAVALIGGLLVLGQPVMGLLAMLGVESFVIRTLGMMSLIVVVASTITIASAAVLRATASHRSAVLLAHRAAEAAVHRG